MDKKDHFCLGKVHQEKTKMSLGGETWAPHRGLEMCLKVETSAVIGSGTKAVITCMLNSMHFEHFSKRKVN